MAGLSVSSLLSQSAYGAGNELPIQYNDGQMLMVVNFFAPANPHHRRFQGDLIHDTINTINRISNLTNIPAQNVRVILDDNFMFPEREGVETPDEQAHRHQLEAEGRQLGAVDAGARQIAEDAAIAVRLAREWGQALQVQEIRMFDLNAQELEQAGALQLQHEEQRRRLQAIGIQIQQRIQAGQEIVQQVQVRREIVQQVQDQLNQVGQETVPQIQAQRMDLIMKDLHNMTAYDPSRTNSSDKKQNKIISKVADNIILNQSNALMVIKELEMYDAKFTEQEIQNTLDDQVTEQKTNQEKAVLFAISLHQLPEETRGETVNNIVKKATEQIVVEKEVTEAVEGNINNRLDNIGFIPIGVASGDDDKKMPKSIWISGLYRTSKQGKSKNTAVYKGNVFGPTFGIDLNINDNTIIGIAYSYILGNFKHTNQSYGKKTDAKSHVLSLYSQAQIGDNLLWNNIFSLSASKVTRKSPRPISQNIYRTAVGKLTSNSYSLETILGYKIPTHTGFVILPNIGMRISQYKDNAYNEKGVGVQNISVASRSNTSIVGILGGKLMIRRQISEDTEIIPVIQTSVEKYFNNKESKVKAKFAWMNDYFQSESGQGKAAKIGYNIGASLLTLHNNVELLAAYNCHLRKKYQSHQGYLKIKLLF